jgi:xylan 1,4-beta-xylosidase
MQVRLKFAVSTLVCAFVCDMAQAAPTGDPQTSIPVTIDIDAAQSLGPLRPIWRFFGADEPNYATMKDGEKLLGELGQLRPGEVFFRTHNLLTTGDGTPSLKWGSTNAYAEDAKGNPIYSWTIVDRIFDTYLARGVRPYVEIGFMPQALSVQSEPYRQDWRPGFDYGAIHGGWAFPPRDYGKWSELVYQWTKHCVERYGRAEVERWYFETWNEANYPAYWYGTPEEFYKLHDYAVDAVRRALPTARVGGPDAAGSGGKFMDDFLKHVTSEKNFASAASGTPTDFVSFHAKGNATFIEGHVRLNLGAHLKTIDEGFAKIANSALNKKPVIIGESDPEACAACQGPQLAYRNSTMYSSYTAASFVRKLDLADRHGINLDGALTWAFEFEDQRYFAGFRALATNGIDLPVLNVFRMFNRMQGQRIAATSNAAVSMDEMLNASVRTRPDIAAFASLDGGKLYIMSWYYHDDDEGGPDAQIQLKATHISGKCAKVTELRVDNDHSNAFTAWQRIGSPMVLNEAQYASIESAGKLTQLDAAAMLPVRSGKLSTKLTLPRQGVSLLEIELQNTSCSG